MKSLRFIMPACDGKTRRLLCVLCAMVAAGSLLLLLIKGCVVVFHAVCGYHETGQAARPQELPPFLAEMSLFATRWPLHYTFYRHPHGTATYLVCGYSSADKIESGCAELGYTLLKKPPSDTWLAGGEGAIGMMLETLSQTERADFDKGAFGPGDWSFFGGDRVGNSASGLFRVTDGHFAVVGVRVLKRTGEEEKKANGARR